MGFCIESETSKHDLFVEKRSESFRIGDTEGNCEFWNDDLDELIRLLKKLKEIK